MDGLLYYIVVLWKIKARQDRFRGLCLAGKICVECGNRPMVRSIISKYRPQIIKINSVLLLSCQNVKYVRIVAGGVLWFLPTTHGKKARVYVCEYYFLSQAFILNPHDYPWDPVMSFCNISELILLFLPISIKFISVS